MFVYELFIPSGLESVKTLFVKVENLLGSLMTLMEKLFFKLDTSIQTFNKIFVNILLLKQKTVIVISRHKND